MSWVSSESESMKAGSIKRPLCVIHVLFVKNQAAARRGECCRSDEAFDAPAVAASVAPTMVPLDAVRDSIQRLQHLSRHFKNPHFLMQLLQGGCFTFNKKRKKEKKGEKKRNKAASWIFNTNRKKKKRNRPSRLQSVKPA